MSSRQKAATFIVTSILIAACIGIWQTNCGQLSRKTASTDSVSVVGAQTAFAQQQQDIDKSRRNAITASVEMVSSAVVGITTKSIQEYTSIDLFSFFYGGQPIQQEVTDLGSGFIISDDGYIITNEHVVHKAKEIKVTMTAGKTYTAELVESDATADIALLKIDDKKLPFVKIGNSDDIIIGEWAIAIGNPFGLFEINNQPSVTVGVISAKNRNFGSNIEQGRSYEDMIQTDASINPGNSGGPLVNSFGEVIGMNTFILTAGGGSQGSIGIGFAIPINKVIKLIPQLKEKAKNAYWIGTISGVNVNTYLARRYQLSVSEGFYVSEIERSSPIEKAGIRKDDIIVGINGKKVKNNVDIENYIKEADPKPGRELKFTVFRNNKTYEVTVMLESPLKKK
jgi:serine protease Do